jgi:hypothetical protein
MKNLFLILFIISSINLFSQGTITEYDPIPGTYNINDIWLNTSSGEVFKYDGEIWNSTGNILFKTDSNVYFQFIGVETYYKLQLSKVDGKISCRHLKKTKPGDFILKFVKQSQTGLTLSIIGGTSSAILPFLIQSSVVLILPPVISLTGFMVWISSYRHLKNYGIIDSAIEFKQ